ncbi:hypothetical protein [Caulobacter hibisci]|uniref:Uncharacterized protein n=1 Tax=Caulobacter hibisci TaxID=2035993 RepID=A0ABS0SZZ3_9CAUL|nr:hypothetical protein [Caulobacter hibisci]MBI1684435.1 hypothetical protein [Caulobacter hibisci]
MVPYAPPPEEEAAQAAERLRLGHRRDAEGKPARGMTLIIAGEGTGKSQMHPVLVAQWEAAGGKVVRLPTDNPIRGHEVTGVFIDEGHQVTPAAARQILGRPSLGARVAIAMDALDRAMPWLMIAAAIAFCLFIAWMVATGAALDAAAVRR